MKPLIRDVVGSRKDIDLEWLDASVETDRARSLGIRATPTLIGYVSDREVVRIVGRRSARELEEMVSSLHGGGRPGRGASRTDTILRTGTGIVLTAVGMLSGPAWPLAAVGAAITGYGLAGWRRSSR